MQFYPKILFNNSLLLDRFSADLKLFFMEDVLGLNLRSKVSHFEELCYLFRCDFLRKVYEEVKQNEKTDEKCSKTVAVINSFTGFLTNFAKTG